MPDPKSDPKPTETDVENTPEQDQNLDRDGRERQPNQQSDKKQ
jgi:hypothetical protein